MLKDQDRLHLGLMLALTFSTGVVDAIGYLGLDRVFTGNMTGNVVILAMGLTGQDGLPIVGPVIALVGFVVGAAIAGRGLKGVPKGWHRRDTVMLAVVAALLLIALVPTAFVTRTPVPPTLGYPVTALLAVAMGIQAGTARHVAVTDVTTVVVTSTLAALAFDSRFGRAIGQTWVRRLLAVALIGLGALAGALLLKIAFWAGLSLAATILVAVAVLGALGQRAHHRARAAEEPASAAR
ncbi:YoaK family protein [Amnibacterium endophyticum]|uniref:YoaK family protein n=1 Tax=Amnibacterium endophyticum TaxID=2109337 RepID=A0ABW4LG32_9MICO